MAGAVHRHSSAVIAVFFVLASLPLAAGFVAVEGLPFHLSAHNTSLYMGQNYTFDNVTVYRDAVTLETRNLSVSTNVSTWTNATLWEYNLSIGDISAGESKTVVQLSTDAVGGTRVSFNVTGLPSGAGDYDLTYDGATLKTVSSGTLTWSYADWSTRDNFTVTYAEASTGGDTSDGGGGGGGGGDTDTPTGGGGGGFTPSNPGLLLETGSIRLTRFPGGTGRAVVEFRNNGSAEGAYTVSITGIARFFAPQSTDVTVAAGADASAGFALTVSDDTAPGRYTGQIAVTVDDRSRTLPITLTVQEQDTEISAQVSTEDVAVRDGAGTYTLSLQTGSEELVPVTLTTHIRSIFGTPISTVRETVMVRRNATIQRSTAGMITPFLPAGLYTMEVAAGTGNRSVTAGSSVLTVTGTERAASRPVLQQEVLDRPVASWMLALLAVVLTTALVFAGARYEHVVRNGLSTVYDRATSLRSTGAEHSVPVEPVEPVAKEPEPQEKQEDIEEHEYACPTCGQTFHSRDTLIIHRNLEHADD